MLDFDLFNPAEMTGFVRELYFNQFDLVNWLPVQERHQIDWSVSRADRRREEMASYRSFDVPAPLGDRPTVQVLRGEIPPISKKMLLTEWERLNLERTNGSTQAAQLIRDVAYDDAYLLTESITARFEYARGTVLQTGQVTYVTDRGFTGIITDYGAVTVETPSIYWDHNTGGGTPVNDGTPLSNLRQWVQNYVIRNRGRQPAYVVGSTKALNAMILTAELRTYAGVGALIPSILTPAQSNQIFQAHGIPPFYTYDAMVNVPGSGDVRVLNEKTIMLLPDQGDIVHFGETTYGVTAESLELVGKGYLSVGTAPGLVGVGMTEYDPVSKWTKVAGLALPVLKQPELISIAQVLA